MTSNQEVHEVRVTMPEIEQTEFITEQRKMLQSAFLEAQKQGSTSDQSQSQGEGATKPLIQRVSPVLINIKEEFKKCFKPRLVALGPLQHEDANLKRAEQSKLKLAAFFARDNDTTDVVLFGKIMKDITYLKSCYNPEDLRDYDDEMLAWMFFVDGSAVLYTVHHGMQENGQLDKLNIKADLLAFTQLDLFLLENQLPYRVLQILIGSTKNPKEWEKSISGFIVRNLITNVQQLSTTPAESSEQGGKTYAHLLHRLREQHLTTGKEEQRKSSSLIGRMLMWGGKNRKHGKTFRSIKDLKESGIRVVPSKTNNIKNIHFDCNLLGRLRMPRLLVDDSTTPKLMNLVELEMCRDFDCGFEVTTYLCFLDYLIDEAKDVKELRATGMLHNHLGSDQEVADLFNTMSRDLVPDQNLYGEVNENILNYCNNPLTTTVAQGYYNYFSTSWSFLAFVGAILGLLFSAVQAYYSLPGTKSDDHNS